MSRRKRPLQDLLQPEITEAVSAAIDTSYRRLRRRALIGRLSPQHGTAFEQRSAWFSCMDVKVYDRSDNLENTPPWSPGLPDWLCDAPTMSLSKSKLSSKEEWDELLDQIELGMEVLVRAGQVFSISKRELKRWPPHKMLAYHYNDDKGAELAAKAHGGDAVAGDTLRAIARDYLQSDVLLPPNLRLFVLMELYGLGAPKQKQGKLADDALLVQRNIEIAKEVGAVIKLGYRAYRSRCPKGRPNANAQWIVWMACQRLGLHIGEREIEECWRKRRSLSAMAAGLFDDSVANDDDVVLATYRGEVFWEPEAADHETFELKAQHSDISAPLSLPSPPK